MVFLISFLTFAIVLDCLILILLVLMQLPKKDAGAGVAFGGAATDALFGAGSGNFLTKATKYGAVTFFCLAMILSILQSHASHRSGSEFRRKLEQQSQSSPAQIPTPAPNPAAGDVKPGTNEMLIPPLEATPPPAGPTNLPPK